MTVFLWFAGRTCVLVPSRAGIRSCQKPTSVAFWRFQSKEGISGTSSQAVLYFTRSDRNYFYIWYDHWLRRCGMCYNRTGLEQNLSPKSAGVPPHFGTKYFWSSELQVAWEGMGFGFSRRCQEMDLEVFSFKNILLGEAPVNPAHVRAVELRP